MGEKNRQEVESYKNMSMRKCSEADYMNTNNTNNTNEYKYDHSRMYDYNYR